MLYKPPLPPHRKTGQSESRPWYCNVDVLHSIHYLKSSLIRGPDGKYSDDDLANILQTATENPANSYGGNGTPACLRVVEIMGIQQARQWGVCTMNEFRQYLGLKRMSWLLICNRFLYLDRLVF